MKMNMIYKFFVMVLAAAVLSTSCIKETFPTDGATQDQIAESTTALESMVGAIAVNMAYPYSAYGSGQNYGFDFGYPGLMCALDACTGDVICTSGDDGAGYDWFWYWERGTMMGPTAGLCDFPWNTYFSFMKSCNDVIGMVDMSKDLSSGEKYALGAAKAFRACFYLDMARQYEALEVTDSACAKYDISAVKELTLPIITEATTEADARNNPRLKRERMFEWILSELDDAEQLLTGLSVKKTVPSLAVVYGLKARAYLWLGQFNNSYRNVKTGQAAYQEAARYARLAITESKATIMTENEWLNATTGFNSANNAWLWYLPQTAEGITNLVNFIAWRSSEATWGYGGKFVFEGVTNNFYNRMSENDWRRKAFIGPKPEEWYKQYGYLTNLSEEEFLATEIPAYANMKFHPANGNTVSYTIGNVTDVPLMRVEEMYLIEAEATAHYDEAAGKTLLEEFMAHRNPKYTAAGVTNLIDEIIFQKRVELWGEGIIFYDFKRLNMGIQNGYTGTNVPTDSRVNVSGRAPWWNFCIPESEELQNPALVGFNNPNPDGMVQLWK